MQTQSVPELLDAVKEYGAHEDFNNSIENNHDKIDFDRKWDHSRTKIGRMLSLDEQIENECKAIHQALRSNQLRRAFSVAYFLKYFRKLQ